MSASRYADNEGEGIPMNLWRNIVRRSINGKRGQRALREIEQALLALPRKRLIAGGLCDRTDVCVVGAMGLYRLMQGGKGLVEALEELPHDIEDEHETAWYGERELGLTETLAWELGRINDEVLSELTPEWRWATMLQWVRDHLQEDTNG